MARPASAGFLVRVPGWTTKQRSRWQQLAKLYSLCSYTLHLDSTKPVKAVSSQALALHGRNNLGTLPHWFLHAAERNHGRLPFLFFTRPSLKWRTTGAQLSKGES